MKRGFMPIAGMEDRFGVEKNKIPLPKRSTSGSAGYDFFAPYDFQLNREIQKLSTLLSKHICNRRKFFIYFPVHLLELKRN